MTTEDNQTLLEKNITRSKLVGWTVFSYFIDCFYEWERIFQQAVYISFPN